MPTKPKAVFLDFATVGPGVDMSGLEQIVDVEYHDRTPAGCEAERIADADVVIVNKARLDRDTIGRAGNTRLIVIVATGTDNVDTTAARDAGIAVTNVRDYCNSSVVQHVFALVLTLTQHVHHYHGLVRSGDWGRAKTFALFDFPIRELCGRNLGIVGYGSLGRSVAEFGRCIGMNILVSARPGAGPEEVPADRVAFEQMLREADVLSLHCPLTEASRHLIGAPELELMKDDAILINTARGGLVDGHALVHALRTRQIGGAGIDVLAVEPPAADEPLLANDLPNLLVTPHIAWAALEARQRAVNQAAENVADFLAGGELRRVV